MIPEMKRNLLAIAVLSSIITLDLSAQNCQCFPDPDALEAVIVEKYYVSGTDDSQDGLLPEGSITYRVFIDMKPDYRLAIGGVGFSSVPQNYSHDLFVRTTPGGQFYNNPFGSAFGDQINAALLNFNTNALDSYLSMGGASGGHFGVPTSADTLEASIFTTTNASGYLLNQDPASCEPLSEVDGLVAGTPSAVSTLGIPSEDLDVFGTSTNSGNFSAPGGTWFVLGGVQGIQKIGSWWDNLL